jgi:hypothetical protein
LSPDEKWVSSPIQCLEQAVEQTPHVIVIHFGAIDLQQRAALVELCAVLKRNHHTRACPVLALLRSRHRRLLEDLERAGVDYVRCLGATPLDSNLLRVTLEGLGPTDRLPRHLAVVCPFLHYSPIDSRRELTICGAYLDRLVLGGRRLQEVCETEDHLHCGYFLNPRIAS